MRCAFSLSGLGSLVAAAALAAPPTAYDLRNAGNLSEAAALVDVAGGTVVEALGLFANYAKQTAEIRVYDHWDTEPAGLLSEFSYTFDLPRYALVDLPSALPRAADGSLVVVVDYGAQFDLPVPYEPLAGAPAGRSYLRELDGQWKDMSTFTSAGVFAVKVVTTPEPPAALLALCGLAGVAVCGRWG
jgi:hypothetical protein